MIFNNKQKYKNKIFNFYKIDKDQLRYENKKSNSY